MFVSYGIFLHTCRNFSLDRRCLPYFYSGGYDMLGRTQDQIRTTEQVNAAMASCQTLKLNGLVIVGGLSM